MEAYREVMDHKKLSGVSTARQGPISYAFLCIWQPYTMEFTLVPSIHTIVCLTGEASATSMAGKSFCSVGEPPAAYNNCQRHSWPRP